MSVHVFEADSSLNVWKHQQTSFVLRCLHVVVCDLLEFVCACCFLDETPHRLTKNVQKEPESHEWGLYGSRLRS